MLNKATLIKQFFSQNKSVVTGAFVFGFCSILTTILIPVFIGKYYQLALHGNSPRGKIFDDIFGTVNSINVFFLYFIILLAVKFVFNYFEKYFSGITGELFAKHLRETVFAKQLVTTVTDFEKKQTGAYLLRYSGDTSAAQNYLVKGIIGFVNDCIFILCALILFSFISFPLTAIVLISIPVIFLTTILLNRRLKDITGKRRNVRSGNLAFVASRLKALLTIKTFNRETIEIEKFTSRSEKLFRYGKKYYSRYALINAVFLFLLYLMLFFLLFYANRLLAGGSGSIDGSVILMYVMLTLTTIPVYKRIIKVNIVWQAGDVSLTKLLHIVNAEEENRNNDDVLRIHHGDVKFHDVSFSYKKGKKLFTNLNLHFYGRSITVISGKQGSGKSTLLKLIEGLYAPSEGSITIDNTNITSASRFALRKHVTIVSDELPLLGDTIFEAISYSRKEEKRKPAEKMLKALGFEISGVSNLLDHNLAEGGRNLSAGQRKLLMIARALLTKKTIMLFDEPFKDLSENYKQNLVHIFHQLKADHTILIIDAENHALINYDNLVTLQETMQVI